MGRKSNVFLTLATLASTIDALATPRYEESELSKSIKIVGAAVDAKAVTNYIKYDGLNDFIRDRNPFVLNVYEKAVGNKDLDPLMIHESPVQYFELNPTKSLSHNGQASIPVLDNWEQERILWSEENRSVTEPIESEIPWFLNEQAKPKNVRGDPRGKTSSDDLPWDGPSDDRPEDDERPSRHGRTGSSGGRGSGPSAGGPSDGGSSDDKPADDKPADDDDKPSTPLSRPDHHSSTTKPVLAPAAPLSSFKVAPIDKFTVPPTTSSSTPPSPPPPPYKPFVASGAHAIPIDLKDRTPTLTQGFEIPAAPVASRSSAPLAATASSDVSSVEIKRNTPIIASAGLLGKNVGNVIPGQNADLEESKEASSAAVIPLAAEAGSSISPLAVDLSSPEIRAAVVPLQSEVLPKPALSIVIDEVAVPVLEIPLAPENGVAPPLVVIQEGIDLEAEPGAPLAPLANIPRLDLVDSAQDRSEALPSEIPQAPPMNGPPEAPSMDALMAPSVDLPNDDDDDAPDARAPIGARPEGDDLPTFERRASLFADPKTYSAAQLHMANELKKALNSARIRVAGKHVNENSASLDASRLIAGAFAESAPSSGYSSLSSSFVFEGQASTAATGRAPLPPIVIDSSKPSTRIFPMALANAALPPVKHVLSPLALVAGKGLLRTPKSNDTESSPSRRSSAASSLPSGAFSAFAGLAGNPVLAALRAASAAAEGDKNVKDSVDSESDWADEE